MSKTIKKTKTFKEYYQDPEFRERHKKYMLTKVKCDCGCDIARNHMSHHKKTKKHQRLLNNPVHKEKIDAFHREIKKKKIESLKEEIDKMNAEIEKLTN